MLLPLGSTRSDDNRVLSVPKRGFGYQGVNLILLTYSIALTVHISLTVSLSILLSPSLSHSLSVTLCLSLFHFNLILFSGLCFSSKLEYVCRAMHSSHSFPHYQQSGNASPLDFEEEYGICQRRWEGALFPKCAHN